MKKNLGIVLAENILNELDPNLLSNIGGNISGLASMAGNYLKDKSIGDMASGAWGGIKNAWNAAANSGAVKGIKDTVSSGLKSIGGFFNKMGTPGSFAKGTPASAAMPGGASPMAAAVAPTPLSPNAQAAVAAPKSVAPSTPNPATGGAASTQNMNISPAASSTPVFTNASYNSTTSAPSTTPAAASAPTPPNPTIGQQLETPAPQTAAQRGAAAGQAELDRRNKLDSDAKRVAAEKNAMDWKTQMDKNLAAGNKQRENAAKYRVTQGYTKDFNPNSGKRSLSQSAYDWGNSR